MRSERNRRILVIDDNRAIHEDFRKILAEDQCNTADLDEAEVVLFGNTSVLMKQGFEVDSAYQGQEGLDLIRQAIQAGRPYAVAFVDIRMPPGWDGVKTIKHLWREDAALQTVICSAYSDYSWDDLAAKLGVSGRLLILKKPFESIEVRQIAVALTEKRHLAQQARLKRAELEGMVEKRTAELQRANDTLKKEIAERIAMQEHTHHLESQLAHASRLAVMGELASGIAHELNQPLTAIAASSDACKRRSQSGSSDREKFHQDMDEITKLAMQAGDTIHRLREFIGNREPHRSSLDVNNVVREASSFLSFETRKNGIPLRLDLAPTIPTVLGDSILTQQVILNLARNAVEAMSENKDQEHELIIRTASADRTTVEIAVCDTGPGMSTEVAERLFEPFFTTKPNGMGLGLSISRSIIEAHGGQLTAAPNPDHGTTFRFSLPVTNGGQNDGL